MDECKFQARLGYIRRPCIEDRGRGMERNRERGEEGERKQNESVSVWHLQSSQPTAAKKQTFCSNPHEEDHCAQGTL